MINFKKININAKKNIIENVFHLMCIKGLEYLSYIIIIPYLVRVLGPGKFGLIALAQAVIHYFIVINNYGFNYSATRAIAISKTNGEKVKILCVVTFAKFILLIFLTFLFFIILISNILPFNEPILLIACYMTVVGNSFFPIYFFQGIEKMKYLSIVNIISRIFSFIAIIFFIKNENDYIMAAFLQSVPNMISAVISVFFIVKNFDIKYFVFPKLKDVLMAFSEGWELFLAGIASNLYTSSNIVVLGYFVPNEVVGYYSGADKIIRGIIGLFSPITQALYPYVCRKISTEKFQSYILVKRILISYLILGIILSLIFYKFGADVINIILGSTFINSIEIFKSMTPLLFIILMSSVTGIIVLIAFNLKKYFKKALFIGLLINFSLILPFINLWGVYGLIITNIVVEFSILIVMFYFIKRYSL